MLTAGCSHFLSSLQVDVAHLRPDAGVDILPNALMTKCAALSVRPDAVADLVKCMRCKCGQLSLTWSSVCAVSVVSCLWTSLQST